MYIAHIEFGNPNEITETIPVTVWGDDDNMSDMIYEAAVEYWKAESWKDKGIALPSQEELKNLIIQDCDDVEDAEYYLENIDTMFGDYNSMLDEKWFRVIELKEL